MRPVWLAPLLLTTCLGCRTSTPGTDAPTAAPSERTARAHDAGAPPTAAPARSTAATSPPDPIPAQPTPPAPPSDLDSFSTSINALGLDLYAALRQHDEVAVLSPASIALALGMTYLGARGGTATQMRRTLHLVLDGTVEGACATLLHDWLAAPDPSYRLAVANRLFVDRSLPIEPGFATLTRKYFGAPAVQLDFAHDAEGGRRHVNRWVKERTAGRIGELLPAGSVTENTRLALANALYFEGKWLHDFELASTRDRPFFAPSGERSVPTMHRTGRYRYADIGRAEALELPYRGHRFAMTVLLPKARDGLGALEASLSAASLAGWLDRGAPERVRLALPRFRLTPAGSLRLGKALRKLGMTTAFERFAADFTAIAKAPRPADNLYLTEVFHQATVTVDEVGTEAAAATAALVAKAGAAAPRDAPPRPFVVDHPFLFVIHDRPSGIILFIGRVTDPAT